MSGLVSILIPCHNAERWVGQAIESALAQTYTPREVIVVDDGSTDGSLDVIRSFGDRIRYATGPNRGANAARNLLLALARGEWTQYLDADDYLLPDKIAPQMRVLKECPDADVLYGLVTKEWRDGDGVKQDLQLIPEPRDPWILLARWYLPQTGGPLFRRTALLNVGGWKIDQPCCQEHELYLRLLKAGKRFVYGPHNGAVYRIWSADTLCHKDAGEVRRRRCDILAAEEAHLRGAGELTAIRLQAINQARFEMARLAWREERSAAMAILQDILAADRRFVPLGNQPGGHHPPLTYRALYRILGFAVAESVAERVHALRARLALRRARA
ncbi:MAG: glycosyltransferase family 2 protein [Methylocystis sp.]